MKLKIQVLRHSREAVLLVNVPGTAWGQLLRNIAYNTKYKGSVCKQNTVIAHVTFRKNSII
jgi:hypothetical protein